MVNPNIISKRELVKYLGLHVDSINRYVKSGKLPTAFKLAGRTSPTCQSYFNIADVRALSKALMPESMAAKQSEHAQYLEIDRRVKKVASALGLDCIKLLLAEFDTQYVDSLHPKHYPAFRSGLMKMNLKQLG
jgi:hypothetical protein